MRSTAAAFLLLVLVAGCSDDPEPADDRNPSVSADEAQAVYGDLAAGVADALGTTSDAAAQGDGETLYGVGDDGVCEFWSQEFEIPVWFGLDEPDEPSWDDVRSTVEDTVPDGWTVGDLLDIPGGWSGFDATEDDTGALLKVRAKGTSTLRVIAPLTGDCADDASNSPVPASP